MRRILARERITVRSVFLLLAGCAARDKRVGTGKMEIGLALLARILYNIFTFD